MLSFIRKFSLFIITTLLILSLIGCNNDSTKLDGKVIESATITKIGEDTNDTKLSQISYKQEDKVELQTFVNAINKAKKVSGIVNVAAPDYLLTIAFEDNEIFTYSLWLNSDSGSIMNDKDTNTLYTLPNNLIEDLNKYVTE
ncbi:hypothetical protein [Niallia sp. 01092]|uniref:hypothetical protein n=1 Tax=unclassified Niallia TaxID=2837522 RepID=UPI003FD3DBBD